MDMLIDDCICENCLAKNHCDVLPYSNNCNKVRAMAKHDKQVYNKAVDDFVEKIKSNDRLGYVGCLDKIVDEIAEQLKVGGENE